MNNPKSLILKEEQWPCTFNVGEGRLELINDFVDLLEDRLRLRISPVLQKPLGLASGATMKPIYKELVNRLNRWNHLDLCKLRESWCSFNLDEYVGLRTDEPNSFNLYMQIHMIRPLHLDQDKVHLPNGMAEDLHSEARRYSESLLAFGGLGIQLLGLGINGHIGFNEPLSDKKCCCRLVCLSESTRERNAIDFNGEKSSVPLRAITLGIEEILAAQEIHLVVIGENKAKILHRLLQSSPNDDLPASWLKLHENVHLWADKEAMRLSRSL